MSVRYRIGSDFRDVTFVQRIASLHPTPKPDVKVSNGGAYVSPTVSSAVPQSIINNNNNVVKSVDKRVLFISFSPIDAFYLFLSHRKHVVVSPTPVPSRARLLYSVRTTYATGHVFFLFFFILSYRPLADNNCSTLRYYLRSVNSEHHLLIYYAHYSRLSF